jgi:predicted transcriptional regulator
MGTTLSVRIDAETKKRLGALAKSSGRTRSFLAAEAIAAYVESESWQIGEVIAGASELDAGRSVRHEDVFRWLRSWGKKGEKKAPRR